MKNYADIKNSDKVESVEFIGGGIGVVVLKKGFGNPKFDNYHSEQQSITSPTEAMALEFVEGAEASRYADTPGGNPCRVAEGTPYACNPHMERYWSM